MASSLFPQQPSAPRNNSIEQMVQAMNAGKRPQDILPELAKTDPAVRQAVDIIRGNSAQAVSGMIQQGLQRAGLTVPGILQRLGIR